MMVSGVNINWVKALSFAAVGITLIAVILAAASIFAAPDVGYSGAIIDGAKLSFTNPSSTVYLTYYSSTYGYQARVAIALGNNITVVANTGGSCSLVNNTGIYYVVGAVDSSNNHYVYIYDSEGKLVKSCTVASGLAYSYIVANGVQVIYLKSYSTSATSGGFQDALNYYINNIDPAIHDAGTGSIAIFWGNFSGNLPISLNFTVNGQSVNAFIWGGGAALETYWLVESNESVGVVTNHYTFTASLGHTYNIYDENWAEAEKNTGDESAASNVTLYVETYSETGERVNASVYVNGSFAGFSFSEIPVENDTLRVKIVASGYESKEIYTRPGRVIVYLHPLSPATVHVTFKAFDAESGSEIEAFFSEGYRSWKSGESVELSAGTHTITASAPGYKELKFTVTLSGDAEIPVYMAKSDSNYTGGVGFRSTSFNDTNQPDTSVYTGCHVGFHLINPGDVPASVTIVGKTYGDAFITGYVEHTGVVDQFTVPPHSAVYHSYDLHDVAWKLGVVIVSSCDVNRAGLYTFTIVSNGKKVAVIKGSDAFNNYVDVYLATPNGSSWAASWGYDTSTNTQYMELLGQMMPILIIALIFGLISQALKKR